MAIWIFLYTHSIRLLFKYRVLEMFEASYLNGIEVKCCEHARNPVLYICTDFKCN